MFQSNPFIPLHFFAEAMCDLTICKLSDFTSPISGGKEIILLCDKVTKGNVFHSLVDSWLCCYCNSSKTELTNKKYILIKLICLLLAL